MLTRWTVVLLAWYFMLVSESAPPNLGAGQPGVHTKVGPLLDQATCDTVRKSLDRGHRTITSYCWYEPDGPTQAATPR